MSLLHLFLLLLCSAAAEGRGIVALEPPPTADAAATSARLLELSRRLSGAGPFGEEQRRDAGLALGYMRALQRQLAGLTLDEDSAEARAQLAEMIAGAERSMNSYEDRSGAGLRPFLSQMAAAAGNQGRALAPPSREEAAAPPPTAAATATPPPGRARPDGRPPLPPPDETPVGLFLAEHPQAAGPRPPPGSALDPAAARRALEGGKAGADALRRDPGDAGALGPGRGEERGGGRPTGAGAGSALTAADAQLAQRFAAERETARVRLAMERSGLTPAQLREGPALRRFFEEVLPSIPENASDPAFARLLSLEDYDELLSRFRAEPNGPAFKDVELRESTLSWARSCAAADAASCNAHAVARGAFYRAGKPVPAAVLKDMLLALRSASAPAPAASAAAPAAPAAPAAFDRAAATAKSALGLPLSPAENAAAAAEAERERRGRKAAWLAETGPALLDEMARLGVDVAELRAELAGLSAERADAVAARLRAAAGEEDRAGVEAAAEALSRELAAPGREGALAALAADAKERERLEKDSAAAFAALEEAVRARSDGSAAGRERLAAASRRADAAQKAAARAPRTAPASVAQAAERLTLEKLSFERGRRERPARAAFHEAVQEHAEWVTAPGRPGDWWVPAEDAGLRPLAASFGFGPGTLARRALFGASTFAVGRLGLTPEEAGRKGVELSAPGGRDGAFVSEDGLLTLLRAGGRETETSIREDGERRSYRLTRREGGREKEIEEGELRNGRFVPLRSRQPLPGGGVLERRFHEGVWYAATARGRGEDGSPREMHSLNPYFDFSRLPHDGAAYALVPGLEDPRRVSALQRLPPLASLAGVRLPPDAKPSELIWDGAALRLLSSTGDSMRITPPGKGGAFGVEHSDSRGRVIFFRDYSAPDAGGSVVETERELRHRGTGAFFKLFRRLWRPGPGGRLLAGEREELAEPEDAPMDAGRTEGFADAIQDDWLYQVLNKSVGQPVGYLGRVIIRGTAGAVTMGTGAAAQLRGSEAGAFIAVRGHIEAELAVTYSTTPSDEQLAAIVDRALANVIHPGQREAVRAAMMDDALRALFASTPGDDWGRFMAAFKRDHPDRESAYRALAPLMAREGSVDGFLAQARKQGGWAKAGAMTISGAEFMGQMAAGAVALKPLHMLGAWAGRASAGTRFASGLAGGARYTSLHDRVAGGVARLASKLPGAGAAPRAALSASDRSARAVAALVNAPVSVGMSVYDADTLGRAALLFAEPDPERAADLAVEFAGTRVFRKVARISQEREAAAAKVRAVTAAAEGARAAERGGPPDAPLRPLAASGGPATAPERVVFADNTLLIDMERGREGGAGYLADLKASGRSVRVTPQILAEFAQGKDAQATLQRLRDGGAIELAGVRLAPEQRAAHDALVQLLHSLDVGKKKAKDNQGGDAELLARAMVETGPGRRAEVHSSDYEMMDLLADKGADIRKALDAAGYARYPLPVLVDPRPPVAPTAAEQAAWKKALSEGRTPDQAAQAVYDRAVGDGRSKLEAVRAARALRRPDALYAAQGGLRRISAGKDGGKWLLIDEMDDGRGKPPPPRPITGDAELDARLDRVRLARGAQPGDRGVAEPVYQKQRVSFSIPGRKTLYAEDYVELVSGERFSSHDLDLMRASGLRPKVLEGMPRVKSVTQSKFDDDFVEVAFEDGRKALYQATGWRVKGTLSPWGTADGDLTPGTLDALWNKRTGPLRLSDGSIIEDAEVMLLFEDRVMKEFLEGARMASTHAAPRGPLEAAKAVADYIERRMPYRGAGSVGALASGGGLIKPAHLLDSAGVCRHQNALAALALEELVRRGELKGRARYNTGPGHAWAEFWPSENGTPLIIDIAQHYVGSAVESVSAQAPKGWLAYMLSSHEPPREKLKTFYAGDDAAGKPQYIPYLEPDSTPSSTK